MHGKLGHDNFSGDQLATINSVVVDGMGVGDRENTKRTRVLSKKRIYRSDWLEYLIPTFFQPCENSLPSILVAPDILQYQIASQLISCPTIS